LYNKHTCTLGHLLLSLIHPLLIKTEKFNPLAVLRTLETGSTGNNVEKLTSGFFKETERCKPNLDLLLRRFILYQGLGSLTSSGF